MASRLRAWNQSIFESESKRKVYMGINWLMVAFLVFWFFYGGIKYGYRTVLYTIPIGIIFLMNINRAKKIAESKSSK